MWARCLAKDGARFGIRVTTVCPGYVDTPIMDRIFQRSTDPANERSVLEANLPMRRMCRPEEVASAVAFLASDEAAYISGTELTLDGALTATQID